MIEFEKLTYKNFLSTGNAGNTILFNRNPTTLVLGKSGSGKSTMIDALCFVLYGKPFRNLKKGQLVNSVNGKKCEVEVTFKTGGKTYKVVRGISPNKFEIHCNDELVTQEAALKDYQKVLEQQILMMSYKTFTQISVIGSSSYKPFMELPAQGRREVIEDILDIGVFSTMNQILKGHVTETKEQLKDIDTTLVQLKERGIGLKKLIHALTEKKSEDVERVKDVIKRIDNEKKDLEKNFDELNTKIEQLTKYVEEGKKLDDAARKIQQKASVLDSELWKIKKDLSFWNDNQVCPTCSQDLDGPKKDEITKTLDSESNRLKIEDERLKDMESSIRERQAKVNQYLETLTELTNQARETLSRVNVLIKRQEEEKSYLEELQTKNTDCEDSKQELKKVANEVVALNNKKKELFQDLELQEAAQLLLKDTGIKSSIVREYVPIINKLLNQYLEELDLPVQFVLDENFNESIKSRHRDDFTYESFSQGERLRIDLSLMFTWRQIAKLKNSAACNILILDEVLVGKLESSCVDIVVDMINKMANEGTRIFALAHDSDWLQDKFRGLITFKKEGNFSVMT